MTFIRVIRGGLQTTLQGAPRTGHRHLGVPTSGPADALSMALANRLVGNAVWETAIETTLTGAVVEFSNSVAFAVTGARTRVELNGREIELHKTQTAKAGDVLDIGAAQAGCRSYLAVRGGLKASTFLGSTSTYLPAKLGGYHGRILTAEDEIEVLASSKTWDVVKTPLGLRPEMGSGAALQAVPSAFFDDVPAKAQQILFSEQFRVVQRASRMGVELNGPELNLPDNAQLPSSAVFPGTLQCPPSGAPFLLLADAQTTGGYLNALQVARVDLHQLGQLRPNMSVRFLRRTPQQAIDAIRLRVSALSEWLSEGLY